MIFALFLIFTYDKQACYYENVCIEKDRKTVIIIAISLAKTRKTPTTCG